ncbi:MAG: hypothetical protein KA010_04080 [Saprospiraceae bacterium]|nr:hypothetical protein [Saprospiraceae bacterium]
MNSIPFSELKIYNYQEIDFPEVDKLMLEIKNFVFIFNETPTEEEISFITKVAEAIHLDFKKDISHFTLLANNQLPIRHLRGKSVKYILNFGVNHKQLGLNIEVLPYKKIQLLDFNIIFCHPIAIIMQHQNLKKLLWDAIKTIS